MIIYYIKNNEDIRSTLNDLGYKDEVHSKGVNELYITIINITNEERTPFFYYMSPSDFIIFVKYNMGEIIGCIREMEFIKYAIKYKIEHDEYQRRFIEKNNL